MNRRATYTGVFVIAMTTLMLEILLTRITSVVAWYHLAFFVISLAMLGMTAGAVVVFMRPGWFSDDLVSRRLTEGSALLAMTTPVCVGLALTIPLDPITSVKAFLATLAYGTALAIPFTVSGVVLTLALTRSNLPAGLVYGVDLCGAALGCVLVIPLLNRVDAPSAVLVSAGLSALAGHFFARAETPSSRATRRRRTDTAILTALMWGAAAANVATSGGLLHPSWIKGAPEAREVYIYSGWNTYSRVTVDRTLPLPPALWAPSRAIPLELAKPIPQRFIRIDGAAGTMMASLDTDPDDGKPGDVADHEYLAWDITSFAHRLRPRGPAAVIGVGGGRDVVEAVRVGHRPVVGIELNDLIVDLHEDSMRSFSGVADLPGVELVGDEARSYLARDERRYSVITMSLIDTWAATGAGAYALSENGLYTIQGWRTFVGRLDETGIFTVSRWYKPDSPGETARMLALAMDTLWTLGAKNPRQHIILLQNAQIATLLVCRSPFSERDINRMQKQAVKRGFNMVLTPRRLPSNPTLAELAQLPNRRKLWGWARTQVLDFTPPTDERPFFFNMLKPDTWLSRPEDVEDLDLAFLGNLYATQTLVYATLASAVLTLLAIVIPLGVRRRELRGYGGVDLLASCLYFGFIGLGFMLVEMALLSRLNVFLGHPTLALAALLGGIIFFTGVGSLASGRIDLRRRWLARLYPLIPAALVVGSAMALDPVMSSFAGAGTATRLVISVAIVGVPALGMGLGFPLGLRLVAELSVQREQPDLGPWMWGINGACGVVASGVALTCSMAWGMATTLFIGAGLYVALVPCTAWLVRAQTTDLSE